MADKKVKLPQKFQPFKWLTTPYRLVVIDEQTLDKVGSYSLKKITLYMAVSTIILLTALATVAIIVWTPVKYYVPGFSSDLKRQDLNQLKQKTDSLVRVMDAQQNRYQRIALVLQGDFKGVRDTNLIDMDRLRNEKVKSYFPQADSIKEDAIEQLKAENKKSDTNAQHKTNQAQTKPK